MGTSHFQVFWQPASVSQDLANCDQQCTKVKYEGTDLWLIDHPLMFHSLWLAFSAKPLPKLLGGPGSAQASLPLSPSLSMAYIVQRVAGTRPLRGSPSPERRLAAQRPHPLPSMSSA